MKFNMESMLDSCMEQMSESDKREKIYRHPVTGIYNRNAFTEAQNHYVTKIALVDMDSLKYINDNQGHMMGDGCICKVGTALQKIFGRDNVFHLSGDEFAVMYEGPRYRFKQHLTTIESITNVGVSAGFGNTLKEADLALNVDKQVRLEAGLRSPSGQRPPWYEKEFKQGDTHV